MQDNAVPSGNAMATTALLRLAALTGEARYRDAAEAALRTVGDLPARHPQAFPQWLVAFQLAGRPFDEVAIVGRPDAPARAGLIAAVRDTFRPWTVVAVASPEATATRRPWPSSTSGPRSATRRRPTCAAASPACGP